MNIQVEVLEVKSIVMDLINGVAGEVAVHYFIFQHEDEAAGDDDGIGAAAHAGEGKSEEDFGIRDRGADFLKVPFSNFKALC